RNRTPHRAPPSHGGGLIRPPQLIEFLRAQQERQPLEEAAFTKCLSQCVADIVRQQAEVGIDVVDDGEFGKTISWSQYMLERLSGFERRPMGGGGNPISPGADRTRFAAFYAELDARDAPATQWEAACIGPIAYTGQAALQRDIANLKAALAKVSVAEAFLPVAAPASVIPDRKNEFYASEDACLAAIAEAMGTE